MSDQEKLYNLKNKVTKKKAKKKVVKKTTKKRGRKALDADEKRQRKIIRDREYRARKKKEREAAEAKTEGKTGENTNNTENKSEKRGDAAYPHVNNPPENDKATAPEQGSTRLYVDLQARHYEWLKIVAKAEQRPLENMLEVLVRRAYASDPTKGGTRNVLTNEEVEGLKNS